VVAQIYGVGLITTRLSGLAFEVGIFVGLGGILVCSFLGGMRAVTWTQVAQYIILIVAYMIPVVWLSVKQTGVPIPQAIYGFQLQKVTEKEKQLRADPKELEVAKIFKERADAGRRQAQGRSRGAGGRQGCRAEEGRRPEGGQCAGGGHAGRREGAGSPAQGRLKTPRRPGRPPRRANTARAKPLGGMPRHAASSRATRTATPRPRRPSTPRAATSWPWSSA
jgi:cation/acetate symporter